MPKGNVARRQKIRQIPTGQVAVDAKVRDTEEGNMKRTGNTFDEIISMPNLQKAADLACAARRDKMEVARFEVARNDLLLTIQRDVGDRTYVPSDFRFFTCVENGKERTISDRPLYPDRILEWAIALVVEPDLDRRMVWQSHASRKGHGIHTCVMDLYRRLADERFRYVLSLDVHRFYQSMDKEIVKADYRRCIKDHDTLWLLDLLVDSYPKEGISLGGRMSPVYGNLYLNALDHHLKEDRHVHAMGRYMDNYYILGYSKPWLQSIQKDIAASLAERGLSLNPSGGVMPVDSAHGFDCLGYVVYSDHILLRKTNKGRMIAALRAIQSKQDAGMPLDSHDIGCIASYKGLLQWCDSYNLRTRYYDPVVDRIEGHDGLRNGFNKHLVIKNENEN